MSRDARKYLADNTNAVSISAVALLVHSPLEKIIGNFFLGLNKPPRPSRLFTSESAALEWLRARTH